MESGFNSGWHDIGRLALAWIPYALGLGACVWLGFFIASRDFINQLSQEKRRAIYVGAEVRPKSKLKIETPNTGSVKITRVDLDGSTAAVYFENSGVSRAWALQIHWQLLSPDGTMLKSGYNYSQRLGGPEELQPGEKAEAVFSGGMMSFDGIALDNRAASMRFWVTNY